MTSYDYDLFVLGSGPAGQRAAIQAAKIGKKVAIAERRDVIGGVCINTGTIPSKTLREAVMYLSGYRERSIYGQSYTVKEKITMSDLLFRADQVIKNEIDVTRNHLRRNGIDVISAQAAFVDPHTLRLTPLDGAGPYQRTADNVVIAVGTETTRDMHIPFDGQRIFTSDDVLSLEKLPRSLAVIGAGVIGLEYATIFATLGTRVTLIDKRDRLLPFVDSEIVDTLVYHMREHRVRLRLGEEVRTIEEVDNDGRKAVSIQLKSGKKLTTEQALYCIGRTGATADLALDTIGLTARDRGLLEVDAEFRTSVPNVYAAGDVIGFPSLASTSMEQGRLAACHAFGIGCESAPHLFPFGIYTIPEISIVGKSEEQLTEEGVPYEVGRATYREIARGQIIGDTTGLLKLMFHCDTRKLLGVSIIGEGASELIHIGQVVLSMNGDIDYFIDTVFNYPTLAECYKVAAFNGINRLA